MLSNNDAKMEKALLDDKQFPVELAAPILEVNSKSIHPLSSQLSVPAQIPTPSKEDAEAEQETTRTQAGIVNNPVHDESQTTETFLLQVATTPGHMAGKIPFKKSRRLQKKLFKKILRNDNGVYRITALDELNIDHQVVLRDGFSDTETWGLEPNFYVVVKGIQRTAFGVAALLGVAFEQDSVGICSHLTDNDLNTWKSSHGQKLSDDVHRVITVRPQDKAATMTSDMGKEIMKHVREEFSDLSGQLDIYGRSIEFHEYGPSSQKFSGASVKQILQDKLSQPYRVNELLAKSALLEAKEYKTALTESSLHVSDMIGCTSLAREHALLFSSQ